MNQNNEQPAQALPVIELHSMCVGCPNMRFEVRNKTLYNGKFPPALTKIKCIHVEACKRIQSITVDKLLKEMD